MFSFFPFFSIVSNSYPEILISINYIFYKKGCLSHKHYLALKNYKKKKKSWQEQQQEAHFPNFQFQWTDEHQPHASTSAPALP